MDTPWKEIMQHYFPAFMEYCHPQAANEIDWSKGYEFLDNELNRIIKNAEIGKRVVDKLVKVLRINGEEVWVLIHCEIQGRRETYFPERMYTYRYRLRDRYNKPIASMAILIDEDLNWRPNRYQEELWGSFVEMQFFTIKLYDYRNRQNELANSINPFAMVIRAYLAAQSTKKQAGSIRLQTKIALTRQLYECGWEKNDIINLYRFIDWILILPPALDSAYHEEIQQIEEENKVQFVTTAERIGIANGSEQGLEKGIEKGERLLILRQLRHRFSSIPKNYCELIEEADAETLLKWGDRLLDAKNIDEIFK